MNLGYVKKCSDVLCPIHEVCTFQRKGRCKMEIYTMARIRSAWLDEKDGIGDLLTPIQMDRFDMAVMPLLHQLIMFRKDMYQIDRPVYTDKKGSVHAYPHFEQIRYILRDLTREMEDLGLNKLWVKKFGSKMIPVHEINPDIGDDDDEDVPMYGQDGGYEAMAGTLEKKKKGESNGDEDEI